MGRRTFSGREVVKVLVNAGGFEWRRTTGDHDRLYYERRMSEDDRRRITDPSHDERRTEALRGVADSEG
jgi:hypothetical protein